MHRDHLSILKEHTNSDFLLTFFNVDNLINFVHRQLKFSMAILDIIMEGNMPQIFI